MEVQYGTLGEIRRTYRTYVTYPEQFFVRAAHTSTFFCVRTSTYFSILKIETLPLQQQHIVPYFHRCITPRPGVWKSFGLQSVIVLNIGFTKFPETFRFQTDSINIFQQHLKQKMFDFGLQKLLVFRTPFSCSL